MKKPLTTGLMIAGFVALVSAGLYVTPAFAHHSFAMYDQTKVCSVNRRSPPIRRSGQPCRDPLLFDRARRQTRQGKDGKNA